MGTILAETCAADQEGSFSATGRHPQKSGLLAYEVIGI